MRRLSDSDVAEHIVERHGAQVPLLEQREQEDKAKIEWLRGAAKEGFDAADRGDYVALRSGQEIDDFVDQVRREVSEKLVAEKVRA